MWDWIRSWVQYSRSSQNLGAGLEDECIGEVIVQRGDRSVAAITSSLGLAEPESNPCKFGTAVQNEWWTEAWGVSSKWLHTLNEDENFWWHATGPALAVMLSKAGYDVHAQFSGLLFHQRMIVPSLGHRPSTQGAPYKWRSFMTDDFSPLEYSWSWDAKGRHKIRYSIEAIGPDAGTAIDPFNRIQTMRLVNELCVALPETNWEWFYHFADAFHADTDLEIKDTGQENKSSSGSSIFLAFELDSLNVAVKAYFIPVKSIQTGESPLAIVTKALEGLKYPGGGITAHKVLHQFMLQNALGTSLQIVGLAVDCVEPCRSRLKYYVRSPYTSFSSVCTIMTLDNQLHGVKAQNGLETLRELWQLVFGLEDDFALDENLAPNRHETAGILYNFDIRPGSSLPEPKIYLPVRHYGRSDLHIAQGVAEFLRQRGQQQSVTNYLTMLESISVHRTLDSGCGLQTYISCTIKEGQLSLASYIAPEVYHPSRWT